MKVPWRLADLVDLEYLLLHEEKINHEQEGKTRDQRDRDIYLQEILPGLKPDDSQAAPSLLLHRWLMARKREGAQRSQEALLPGRLWDESYRAGGLILLVVGLISGAGLTLSLLNYSGTQPVNVSLYLGLLVGTQLLLLGVLGSAFCFRRLFGLEFNRSLLYGLLSRQLVRIILRIRGTISASKDAAARRSSAIFIESLPEKLRAYGALFAWPFFIWLQLLAIGFNIGVVTATLGKVITSDVAFGWQSTLRVSDHFVATLVQWMAMPWAWLVPDTIACPTLSQIEGSKLILKEGLYHLATEDLVSWWPFLCLAVLFYGLLPRVALLLIGRIAERRLLAQLEFTGSAHRQLLRRMTTPLILSQAPTPDTDKIPAPEAIPFAPTEEKGPAANIRRCPETGEKSSEAALCIIPDELYIESQLSGLQTLVRQRLGLLCLESFRIGEESVPDTVYLQRLADKQVAQPLKNLVILQEGWQPPVQEFFSLLEGMRNRMGADVPMTLALVGKPTATTICTPVKKEDLRIWLEKTRAMGRPDIQVVALITER